MRESLGERLEPLLGARPTGIRQLHGGCIALVYRIDLADGRVVVVKLDQKGNDNLVLEADMLRYLSQKSELPVPAVIHAAPDLLVLEHLPGESRFSADAERHAAELLASLHSISADHYGFDYDTLVGSLPQPNPRTGSWPQFFREQRLLHMTAVAYDSGNLPQAVMKRLDALSEHLEEFGLESERPALIHGDVWSSNVLAADGRICGFLDPACYYAEPEIELAFITLFNTFGRPFFERYGELRPIRPGFFEARRDVYNLYPLLVHVTLFGEGYVASVERILSDQGF